MAGNSILSFLLRSQYDGKGTRGAKDGLADVKRSVGDLTQGLFGMNLASLTAGGALVGVALGAKKAVEEIVFYNKSVSDSAGATGMAVEEFSRFVQVADDFGIEMDSVTRTLELATKNGFAPSIDSIADLADETSAMNDPTERAAYLAKILGRNWAELDPVLRAGGKAIRENAAVIADGLVVTQAEIEKTETLRLAVDDLGDQWTALKNELAMTIVVPVVESMRASEAQATSWSQAVQALRNEGILPTKTAIEGMFRAIEEGKAREELFKIRDALEGLPAQTNLQITTYHNDVYGQAPSATAHASYQSAGFWWVWSSAKGYYVRGEKVAGDRTQEEISHQARGGPLAGVALVGEEGPELIIGGVVVPAPETRKLLALGLMPTSSHRFGGETENVTALGSWPTAPINPDPYGGLGNIGSSPKGGMAALGLALAGSGSRLSATSATSATAASAAAVAAVAQQAAVSASAGVASAIPMAISQQMAESDRAADSRQMALIFEVRELRETIVRAVREGVQMAQGWSG